jgi:hypothetical protein
MILLRFEYLAHEAGTGPSVEDRIELVFFSRLQQKQWGYAAIGYR